MSHACVVCRFYSKKRNTRCKFFTPPRTYIVGLPLKKHKSNVLHTCRLIYICARKVPNRVCTSVSSWHSLSNNTNCPILSHPSSRFITHNAFNVPKSICKICTLTALSINTPKIHGHLHTHTLDMPIESENLWKLHPLFDSINTHTHTWNPTHVVRDGVLIEYIFHLIQNNLELKSANVGLQRRVGDGNVCVCVC